MDRKKKTVALFIVKYNTYLQKKGINKIYQIVYEKKTEFNHFNIINDLQLIEVIRGPGAQSVTLRDWFPTSGPRTTRSR